MLVHAYFGVDNKNVKNKRKHSFTIQFVEFNISGLSNSKVLIGALSHVLHAKHQLEEALDAVTPLVAHYRLKHGNLRDLDIFIENIGSVNK